MDWNSGAEQVFGYTAEEVIGQPNAIVFTPENRAQNVPAQEMQQAHGARAALWTNAGICAKTASAFPAAVSHRCSPSPTAAT